MKCCVQCFQHLTLVEYIKKRGATGNCDYCSAQDAQCIEASRLGELFSSIVECYEPAEEDTHLSVSTLAECMQEWEVFAEDRLDTAHQNALLDDIRFGGMQFKRRFEEELSDEGWAAPASSFFATDKEDLWEEFSQHLKHKRRFLPNSKEMGFAANPCDWLPELLEATDLNLDATHSFFRAREGSRTNSVGHPDPLPTKELGAPPREKARGGRANPPGIAYLYVAEEEATALAEIRPFVGAKVTLCKLRPNKSLKIADLTRDHFVANPFGRQGLSWLIKRNALLNMLNEKLAEPVNPAESDVEYLPTQYLAEVILDAGYDGIRYKSALTDSGSNLVFFHPEDFTFESDTRLVQVTSIAITYRAISSSGPSGGRQ